MMLEMKKGPPETFFKRTERSEPHIPDFKVDTELEPIAEEYATLFDSSLITRRGTPEEHERMERRMRGIEQQYGERLRSYLAPYDAFMYEKQFTKEEWPRWCANLALQTRMRGEES